MYQNMNQTDKNLVERTVACAIVVVCLRLSVYSGMGPVPVVVERLLFIH